MASAVVNGNSWNYFLSKKSNLLRIFHSVFKQYLGKLIYYDNYFINSTNESYQSILKMLSRSKRKKDVRLPWIILTLAAGVHAKVEPQWLPLGCGECSSVTLKVIHLAVSSGNRELKFFQIFSRISILKAIPVSKLLFLKPFPTTLCKH